MKKIYVIYESFNVKFVIFRWQVNNFKIILTFARIIRSFRIVIYVKKIIFLRKTFNLIKINVHKLTKVKK
jgi:hypothetical protein